MPSEYRMFEGDAMEREYSAPFLSILWPMCCFLSHLGKMDDVGAYETSWKLFKYNSLHSCPVKKNSKIK